MGILDEIIALNKRTRKVYRLEYFQSAATSDKQIMYITDTSLPFLRNLLEAEGWKDNRKYSPDVCIAAYVLPDFSGIIHVVPSSDIYDLRCETLNLQSIMVMG